ncbi:hypothetical protein P8A18_10725 [Streptomyces castrisilvae]|uniref:Uncharacterized protein n=1 Tax=Streptomyces castrisilvae TaxID=3033811 RepID=A0ABY9HH78_9ACTN|nr:hypothetical protein [Streptomyces sp. Mut1]WLQ33893.1 hypothetical protein P8A18_10725 [Streptomyces sp. Mut1]
MTKEGIPDPRLERWAEEGRLTIIDVADMLGVPPSSYASDPLNLVPALQNYASRLPFHEFEESDWVTFQTDLMAYVADFLIQCHGAWWTIVDDSRTTRGYRYVIEATGLDGDTHGVDPVDIVREELMNDSIEVVRMLASAELTLRLTQHANESK